MTIHSCSYYCQRPECVARRVPVWSIRLHEYHGSKVVKHHQCFIRSLSRPKAIDAARRQIKQGSPRKVGPLALFSALYATPEDLGAQPTPATLAAMAMFRYLAWGWAA